MATTTVTGVQYSGIWTMQQVNAAIAAGTWPVGSPNFLYGWGFNNYGQAGLGNTTLTTAPTLVSADTWSSVASTSEATSLYNVAIKNNGTLWVWGFNAYGNLGLGNTTYYSSPKQVGALTAWSKVSTGGGHTLAIKTDGTLWSWGNNNQGQLGLGNTTNYSSPKQIGALTNWSSISGSSFISFAVKTDGTMWSWGYNGDGALGLNNLTNYSSPKQIGALTTWLKIAGGYANCFAIKTDGTAWCWGRSSVGQLGLGNLTTYSSPKQIGALTDWAIISSGARSTSFAGFTAAIKTGGSLWSWGYNPQGQLGIGNTTNYSSPKQVGSLTNWSKVVAGSSSCFSIKTDGTLWAWGRNDKNELALGNATNYSSPKQVGSLTTWLQVAAGYFAGVGITS